MMCQYGNCHEEEDLPILVTNKERQTRERFCSQEHAILGMLGWLHSTKRRGPGMRDVVRQVEEELSWTPVALEDI